MKFLAVLLLLLTVVGCGYHFPAQGSALPGGVQKIFIPLFANGTAEPRLENYLSSKVSEVFARNENLVQVEDRQQAEAVLEGVISSYRTRAYSYDKNDDISEYRSTMVVNAKFRQIEDGRLLWQGQVSWDDEYPAADDKSLQEDFEQEAIEEISLRLAEELFYRLLDDF
ncbi:MAG: hypothetical protein GQ578_08190 [Desulfuromonadaceae bacterium]|nr:hypothetical protein [Desulfuromonadaceae bacterium]